MMNIIKNSLFYVVLILIVLYKGVFTNITANINSIFTKNDNPGDAEISILNSKIKSLENDLESVTNLKQIDYDYSLTRLSYRKTYDDNIFYIYGGKNKYKEKSILINSRGVVGVIKNVNEEVSECETIKNINLSIKINDTYGTISGYEDGLFIVKDVTNYESVHLNDEVYTSNYGEVNLSLFVGKVVKIDENILNKIVYIKSDVDFDNINFLYVVG